MVLPLVVLDSESGEISEQRFGASREELGHWAMSLQGGVAAVAIEATTGWRWVWRELVALGFDVRLADPSEVKALRGMGKRAKIIHAEGEYQAAEKLLSAARTIAKEPVAVQLRYLQTLTEIGVEQNTTVVFPIPMDLIQTLTGHKTRQETFTVQPREPVEVS